MAHILLADDDAASRDLVARALAADGHSVDAAQDGAEALERLGTRTYQLLVTDVQMPGLDGVTLATRALAASSDLHVVLMSGFTSELDRGAGLAPGRVHVISKPFSLDQIKATVRAALR